MSSWECTYRDTLNGGEFTKTCYTSCCETDCCGDESSAGLIAGISVPTIFVVCFIIFCCRLCMRRQAASRQAVVVVPPRTVVVTSTTVTRASAPVPQHQGYDQPNYQPSTMPSPAQFQPPPPYTEQAPKTDV